MPASGRVNPAKASTGLAEMLGEDLGKMQGKTALKPKEYLEIPATS
jgi:hypothetical protein